MQMLDFDRWLAERNMNGHWTREVNVTELKPYLWKWGDIWEACRRACDLIPVNKTGRRTIQLRNPGLKAGTTRTMNLSVQAVLPGEIARAHHHTAAAVRYVIKGSPSCYTVVEGERFPMEEGDLISTPSLIWHDHCNCSREPVVWLDAIDAPLVRYLGVRFTEDYPLEQQVVEKPDGYSLNTLSRTRPRWVKTVHRTPPYHYRWADTSQTLLALKESEGDPFDGVHLAYVNPINGGPTLPTFSCEIQLLRAGEKTRVHRHSSSAIYCAFRGDGRTRIGDDMLCWNEGDIFVAPGWLWHSHENQSGEDALLFSINDRPMLEALGVYREEVRT